MNNSKCDLCPHKLTKEEVVFVKKAKNVKAYRKFPTEEEANALLKKVGVAYVKEYRPGENKRCMEYCTVSRWCTQWMNIQDKEARPTN